MIEEEEQKEVEVEGKYKRIIREKEEKVLSELKMENNLRKLEEQRKKAREGIDMIIEEERMKVEEERMKKLKNAVEKNLQDTTNFFETESKSVLIQGVGYIIIPIILFVFFVYMYIGIIHIPIHITIVVTLVVPIIIIGFAFLGIGFLGIGKRTKKINGQNTKNNKMDKKEMC